MMATEMMEALSSMAESMADMIDLSTEKQLEKKPTLPPVAVRKTVVE